MITGLIKAEIRKIFTVNLWWALLIPVVLLSFGAGWLGTAIGTLSDLRHVTGQPLPLGLLTVSLATNFSTIFAALFGMLAVAGEHRNKSITTSFLTATPRGAVLGAKLVAYLAVGVLYGVANVLFASFGSLVGAGFHFGASGDWFMVSGAGVLVMVLWTLLGVGFGALLSNPVVAIIVLLAYRFVVESILNTYLAGTSSVPANLASYLPVASANGIMGNLSVPIFIQAITGQPAQYAPSAEVGFLYYLFGGTYGHAWWLSVLTFVGYTVVFVGLGWLATSRRDIT